MRTRSCAVVVAVGFVTCGTLVKSAETPAGSLTLSDAQREFYNARYDNAAAQTLELRTTDPEDLAAHELRASALLFQLKNALGPSRDKQKGFKGCVPCPQWMTAFLEDTASGQAVARRRLAADPAGRIGPVFPGQARSELRVASARVLSAARQAGTSIGRRDARSTPCSRSIPGTCEVASRVPGSTTSWIRGCRGGRAGSWAAAAGNGR